MSFRNLIRALLAFLLLLQASRLAGQDLITITGVVRNSGDSDEKERTGKFPPISGINYIYCYNTLAEAKNKQQEAKEKISRKELFDPGYCRDGRYIDGEFEMTVPGDGALLIMPPSDFLEPLVIPIKGRTHFELSFNMNIELAASVLTYNIKRPEARKPKLSGNTLNCGMSYPFPREHLGRTDARLVVQTFVLDCNDPMAEKHDTIEYHFPIVMDGAEYHTTQLRRKGFVDQRDPLLIMADSCSRTRGWLNDTTSRLSWEDSYFVSSRKERVLIRCHLWLEDYNRVYFRDTLDIADSRRVSNPLKFLRYDTRSFPLDMDVWPYAREPRPQPMSDESNLSLRFSPGASKVDEKDTSSVRQLADLLQSLRDLEKPEEGSSIHQIAIYGTASPEGSYAKNQVLANKRMEYIRDRIKTVIKRPMGIYPHAEVATWEQMADTLSAESLFEEAEAIRAIAAKYPDNMDTQGYYISKLSSYRSIIAPRLAKLRTVKVVSDYEMYRNMTGEEILQKFRGEKKGKKHTRFANYEYIALFKMIDSGKVPDLEEQEEIYRTAVNFARVSKERNWQLPENRLAQFLIAQNRPDTTILAPHVYENWYSETERRWCDRKFNDEYYRNPSALVANQVVMMLKSEQYERAGELVEMLPREENEEYKALFYIASCLAGLMDDVNADEAVKKEVYDAICNTSPRNSCVMNLYLGKYALANADIEEMDPDDAVTHYLKAQSICLFHYDHGCRKWDNISSSEDKDLALEELARCFSLDPALIPVAESDFDLFEDLVKMAREQ